MSLKDAYREKMEAQIEEQRARLELLKAKAKRAVADVKIMAYEEIGDADAKLDALKAKLQGTRQRQRRRLAGNERRRREVPGAT